MTLSAQGLLKLFMSGTCMADLAAATETDREEIEAVIREALADRVRKAEQKAEPVN